MDRILGIDYGDRRVGLSLSDPLGLTAQGLDTVEERDRARLIERLAALAAEREVARIVVGLPRTMGDEIGARARVTLAFVEALRARVAVPVETWDERLTSRQAERALAEAGVRGAKRRGLIDRLAAQFMLQSYLDAHRPRGTTEPDSVAKVPHQRPG